MTVQKQPTKIICIMTDILKERLPYCTDPSPPRREALKGRSTQYGVDQNARTVSSRLKKKSSHLALSATIPPALVRRLENKPIH